MLDPTELIDSANFPLVLFWFARELTLFWSKLLIRLESPTDVFLEQSKKMTLLCRSVCHILFFIKVIQNEVQFKKTKQTKNIYKVCFHVSKGTDFMFFFWILCFSGRRGGASSVRGNVHSGC